MQGPSGSSSTKLARTHHVVREHHTQLLVMRQGGTPRRSAANGATAVLSQGRSTTATLALKVASPRPPDHTAGPAPCPSWKPLNDALLLTAHPAAADYSRW